MDVQFFQVFPGGASDKEPTCQCRRCKRCGFNLWVGKIPWRRKWQATPVSLPGESHGQRSLEGYSPQDCKELDTTEASQHIHICPIFSASHIKNSILFSIEISSYFCSKSTVYICGGLFLDPILSYPFLSFYTQHSLYENRSIVNLGVEEHIFQFVFFFFFLSVQAFCISIKILELSCQF